MLFTVCQKLHVGTSVKRVIPCITETQSLYIMICTLIHFYGQLSSEGGRHISAWPRKALLLLCFNYKSSSETNHNSRPCSICTISHGTASGKFGNGVSWLIHCLHHWEDQDDEPSLWLVVFLVIMHAASTVLLSPSVRLE